MPIAYTLSKPFYGGITLTSIAGIMSEIYSRALAFNGVGGLHKNEIEKPRK